MGEEVRISCLGPKPAPRSEKAEIVSTEINGHTAHKNELAATRGLCAVYLRDISRKLGALGTHPNGLFWQELLVLDKKCAGRFLKGPGLRGRGSRQQIDRGSRRGVFSSTFQRNAVL